MIKAADGDVAVQVIRPDGAVTTGVILYMDAFGPRPALFEMATRIAGWGHVVVVPDLFYRFGAYGPFDPLTAFVNEVTRAELMTMLGTTTQDQTVADTAAFLHLLTDEGVTGRIGTVGYCMGGARALNAAAAYPDRIVAAASFHGGGLASDAADSPHRRVAAITGRVYVGGAGVDRSFPPEQSAALSQALREAEVDHITENYVGMQHGWTVPDHSVYDAKGADRHWRRLAEFFGETLV
jgi:carboxymethylenebutenolidase